MSDNQAPNGMISVEEFSKQKGISEDKLIKMIKDGFYSGRLVNEKWFVESSDESEAKTNIKSKEDKTQGIALTVIGGAIGVWAITRYTSFAGALHSWSPPFSQYEGMTMLGAGVGVLMLIVGLKKLIN